MTLATSASKAAVPTAIWTQCSMAEPPPSFFVAAYVAQSIGCFQAEAHGSYPRVTQL